MYENSPAKERKECEPRRDSGATSRICYPFHFLLFDASVVSLVRVSCRVAMCETNGQSPESGGVIAQQETRFRNAKPALFPAAPSLLGIEIW